MDLRGMKIHEAKRKRIGVLEGLGKESLTVF